MPEGRLGRGLCPSRPGYWQNIPSLKETPLADPAQRTEWNVRDADACMIVIAAGGLAVSKGTALAEELAHRHRKPGLVPVTLGLTAASAVVVARAADDTRVAVGITVATALMTYWIRVNPLWIFAVAALLGLSGVV